MVSFKALPLLFAAPSALQTNYHLGGVGRSHRAVTSLRSTVEKSTDASSSETFTLRDMVAASKHIYRTLADGCFTTRASPTISFHYTRPVSERKVSSSFEDLPHGSDDATHIYEEIQASHDDTKPLLLYLPGLDGVGVSAVQQFDDLSNTFELWRMRIDPETDKSSFAELTNAVSDFIQDVAIKQNRKVILVGESFGGLLAPSVAMKMEAIAGGKENSPVMGLVMVNPATSFYKTNWSTWAPILASLRHIEQEEEEGRTFPTPYSVLGGVALSMTIPDSSQYQSILNMITKTSTDELQDVLTSMRDGFGILADNLPAKIIEHRVSQWCNVGSQVVNPRLHKLNVPTLFIGGDSDNMLPTKEEGDRLVDLMPDCTSMSVKDAGHFILDDRFNLTEAIVESPFDPLGLKTNVKKYDPIADWQVPTDAEILEAIDNRVKPLRDIFSPQFFSTGTDGKRMMGLGKVPSPPNGPILFVANHQLIGLDLGMIIAELLEKRNIAARGLAHPIVFQGGNGFGGGAGPTGPSGRITKRNKDGAVDPPPGDFQTFGAVMVTPKNFYRLMQSGQTGLLFPGGVREVFHGKGEEYELFWPEKTDFVRIAARYNATIVPISAVGAADSANILLDAEELLNLPFGLGDRLKNSSDSMISARFDAGNSDERFVPPLVVPSVPARHYFVFGKPFDTSTVDPKDKDACATLYGGVKSELRRGLDDVLVARESDPFKNFAQRYAVERISGKPAPTFPVDELNK